MRIVLCVTNDIVTDQRIRRIANSLIRIPAEVLVVGIKVRGALPLTDSPFHTHRFNMLFSKGPLFYAEYNIRLLLYLVFVRASILVSNDLDTLPAVFMASRIRRRPIVYDSHEYFTQLPELVDRHNTRKIWEKLESVILPRIRYSYTVSSSIAREYNSLYGIRMTVVRNLPFRVRVLPALNSPKEEKTIIYQGALNMGRGLELAISAMQYLENTRLLIAGSGYFESDLRQLVTILKLGNKVVFLGRIEPVYLFQQTVQADLGISLEENRGLNYYFALPNKLFDYIQARIPVLVSNLPEMALIVNKYQVGRITDTQDPRELSVIFNEMLNNQAQRKVWTENLEHASEELCWENEESKLLEIYRSVSLQIPFPEQNINQVQE